MEEVVAKLLGEDTQITVLRLEGEGANHQVVGRCHRAIIVDGITTLNVVSQVGGVGPDGGFPFSAATGLLPTARVNDPQGVNHTVIIIIEPLPEIIGGIVAALSLQRFGRLNDQVRRSPQLAIGRSRRLIAGNTEIDAIISLGMGHRDPWANFSRHRDGVIGLSIIVGLDRQPTDIDAIAFVDVGIALT